MRLSRIEQGFILQAIEQFFTPCQVDVYLHGSRLNDSLKGGDIDLIVVLDKAGKEKIKGKSHYLQRDIKKSIGDQRIDLIFACPEDLKADPFLRLVMQKAQPLAR